MPISKFYVAAAAAAKSLQSCLTEKVETQQTHNQSSYEYKQLSNYWRKEIVLEMIDDV